MCFATDSSEKYEGLKDQGYENVIFTNRKEIETNEDTTVYEGTTK